MEDRVEAVVAKIRPYIKMHGGDVMLTGIKDGVVTLKIYGACVGCSLADLTYNKMVGPIIRKEVPAVKEVIFDF
jgi:Fe-S cluster biogenesis protein NfuA